jgi:cysteine desulfurase
MKVYLDNAATTRIDDDVFVAMIPYLKEEYGNPSSIHAFGRKTKTAIEQARKTVAKYLNASPTEIFFTSGGTEADNMAIIQSIDALGLKHAISSKIEHHAVENTLQSLEKLGKVKVSWVNVDEKGNVDLLHLEELLKKNERSFVSLMHANNEIGTLLPIEKVGDICEKYNAIFHSDTVQTMGHYKIDLQKVKVHFVTCAAHKFHGPKGVGFIYINHNIKIKPIILGGAQERNMRAGTECTYGIVGLAKAFEISHIDMNIHQSHVLNLKNYMMDELKKIIPDIEFNGEIVNDKSLYTILNCRFPEHRDAEMMLFNLDIAGVSASGGSACTSGSDIGSHVLTGIGVEAKRPSIRFSFSKYNTKAEIDYTIEKLKSIIGN